MSKGFPLLTWRVQLRPHPSWGSAQPAAHQSWEAAAIETLLAALRADVPAEARNRFDGEVALHVWEGVDTPPASWIRLHTFAAAGHLEGLVATLGEALAPVLAHPGRDAPPQHWTFHAWAGTDEAPIGWGRHSLHIHVGGWPMGSACAARLALCALGHRTDPIATPPEQHPVLRPRGDVDEGWLARLPGPGASPGWPGLF
jgi:hypothetical protein